VTNQGAVVAEAFVLETLRTARTKAWPRGGSGGGRLRRASVVEWGTVPLPDDRDLRPEALETLLARSHEGEPRELQVSADTFGDLMDGELG
jgi:hypothetical protein